MGSANGKTAPRGNTPEMCASVATLTAAGFRAEKWENPRFVRIEGKPEDQAGHVTQAHTRKETPRGRSGEGRRDS